MDVMVKKPSSLALWKQFAPRDGRQDLFGR